jgi:hypothetical protein
MSPRHDSTADFPIAPRRRRLVNITVLAIAALSVVALVALWPRDGGTDVAPGTDQLPTANATVTETLVGPCAGTEVEDAIDCFLISVRMSNGPLRGEVGYFEQSIGGGSP